MNTIHPKRQQLHDFADRLYNRRTLAELQMAQLLTKHGLFFLEQRVIGRYIADILLPYKMLIIELDGNHHYLPEYKERDASRTVWLKQFGFRVFRYDNIAVPNIDVARILAVPDKDLSRCADAWHTADAFQALQWGEVKPRRATTSVRIPTLPVTKPKEVMHTIYNWDVSEFDYALERELAKP